MIATEQGFTVAAVEPLEPLVDVGEATREQMMLAAAAMLLGDSPQAIATQVRSRWRPEVVAFAARPSEADELYGHVSCLLALLQSPAG